MSKDFTTLLQTTTSPLVMGILNVTPDSFSDGGQFDQINSAIEQAELMIQQGADIIDIGGESTRPNAEEVSLEEELSRVIPAIKAIKSKFDVWVSIDTSKAEVMKQAVEAGADIINDVRALTLPGALDVAVQAQVPVCLMHMQGQPKNMQNNPQYDEVVTDVLQYLLERADECTQAGIAKANIIIDPGFGFGKTADNNFKILNQLDAFTASGYPVLAGLSRKTMIGHATGQDVENRVYGSVAGALICAQKGADIIRVHDVQATVDALAVLEHTQRA
ncbi:dihydropteroate synthase [Catenovulum sp. SM1970]|uniref:dihydropteroate synthase n=1 Tax=Marinifaba aquimaris TaxID=2741323 RepID=UPI001571E048|nr:dihydropteroate synthase [Marinifaba aquimaris]NTS75339.1 dihydropteroate synthase [Marinifaba aquimaris]